MVRCRMRSPSERPYSGQVQETGREGQEQGLSPERGEEYGRTHCGRCGYRRRRCSRRRLYRIHRRRRRSCRRRRRRTCRRRRRGCRRRRHRRRH